jgi:signal transduction histidine kinase
MRVVGALASGVAHEVKNPLATILYGVTYLKENLASVDEKVGVVLTTIHEATERANNIIVDLLDFSSMNKLNKTQTDINALIGKTLQLIQHEVESRHIKIERNGCEEVLNLTIDSNRIEQVLINIFLNATYAMNSGGVLTIGVNQFKVSPTDALYSKLKSGGFSLGDSVMMVSVGDTGKGIPDEQLNKVFEPFFTTRRAQGGVGLGLAVAKNIMDLHGGLIFFDNKPEGGAQVRIIFPVKA